MKKHKKNWWENEQFHVSSYTSIDEQVVARFHGELKIILDAEIKAGNVIVEAWHGDWPIKGISAISLWYPFKTPIQRDFADIEYHDVNDPHSWKAEYFDKVNNQLLICKFAP